MDQWMDGIWMDRRNMDGWIHGFIDDGWIDDGWMDANMDRHMDR